RDDGARGDARRPRVPERVHSHRAVPPGDRRHAGGRLVREPRRPHPRAQLLRPGDPRAAMSGEAGTLALPPLAGLGGEEVEERRTRFGSNRLTEIRGRPFLAFVRASLDDRTLKILLVSAAVVLALDWLGGRSAIDGAAILVAVAVASFVSSFNEWRA